MTYTELAIAAVLVTVVLDLVVFRTRLVRSRAFWVSYAIMLAFQLVVDGLLAGLPVVRYRATAIVGARIAYAPVEDVLFGFSLVLATLSWWVWLSGQCGRRRERPARTVHEFRSPPKPTTTRRDRPTERRAEKTS
jgi:lycopene cyclase domain-containing protein